MTALRCRANVFIIYTCFLCWIYSTKSTYFYINWAILQTETRFVFLLPSPRPFEREKRRIVWGHNYDKFEPKKCHCDHTVFKCSYGLCETNLADGLAASMPNHNIICRIHLHLFLSASFCWIISCLKQPRRFSHHSHFFFSLCHPSNGKQKTFENQLNVLHTVYSLVVSA